MVSSLSSPSTSPSNSMQLEVSPLRIDTKSINDQSAMMMKLTDESIVAIQKAQKARLPIRIKIDSQGGTIEIGSSSDKLTKFKFFIQKIHGEPSDAILFDRVDGYSTTAIIKSKIQVQTTEKSLAETREKAQKMAEEEKKKKALKEDSKHKRDHHSVTVKRATNPLAIGAQRPNASVIKANQSDSSRITSIKNSTNPGNSISNASFAGAHSYVKAEISRRPLRKRLIHLIVLGRFNNFDEIISQFRKDSLNEEINQEDIAKARDIIDEISEISRETNRLQLKAAYFNEVDARWPGFSSDEKSFVRKILSSNFGIVTNFAPTRKKGMAPMTAPLSAATHGNSISPEGGSLAVTNPTSLRPPSANSTKKISPERQSSHASNTKNLMSSNNGTVNVNTEQHTGSDDSSTSSVKKRALPSSTVVPNKRPRNESLSPPEDPSCANQQSQNSQKTGHRNEKLNNNNNNSSNMNERQQQQQVSNSGQTSNNNTNSMTLANSPLTSVNSSKDWSKEFGEPRSLAEAEKYFEIFNEQYPIYMECYNRLSLISDEFIEMDKQLKEIPKNSREYEKLERTIQAKFFQYYRDPGFRQTQQKHADLRAKLEVLKKRIASWESNYTKAITDNDNRDFRL